MSNLRDEIENGALFPYGNEDDLKAELEALENELPSGAFEILPGMTVTEMKTLFFDAETLIEPDYRMYQLNSTGHRYYYTFDENGEPVFYPSVTTIISQTMKTSQYLINWIAEKGVEEADRYKTERAYYGTFMHACYERLLINGSYDLDNLNEELKQYIEDHRLPIDFIAYADELKKDVLAFAQFVIDHDVRPYAIEIALKSDNMGTAGMLDLPCNMLEQIGGTKRINAIIDFKSGRKNFYPDHVVQLHMYKQMWNENFPKFPIDRVFNFAPAEWRKKPNYKLKDQTKDPDALKITYLLGLAAIEEKKKSNTFTAVSGVVSIKQDHDIMSNVLSMTLSEVIKKRAPKDEPMKVVEVSDFEKAIKETSENTNKASKTVSKKDLNTNIPEEKESIEIEEKTTENDFSDLLGEEF